MTLCSVLLVFAVRKLFLFWHSVCGSDPHRAKSPEQFQSNGAVLAPRWIAVSIIPGSRLFCINSCGLAHWRTCGVRIDRPEGQDRFRSRNTSWSRTKDVHFSLTLFTYSRPTFFFLLSFFLLRPLLFSLYISLTLSFLPLSCGLGSLLHFLYWRVYRPFQNFAIKMNEFETNPRSLDSSLPLSFYHPLVSRLFTNSQNGSREYVFVTF